jgi:hypothetical protein
MNNDPFVTEIPQQTFTETKIFKYFVVYIDRIVLFESVSLRVDLLDENKGYIKTRSFELTGNDYDAWGNNDQYIFTKVAELLGASSTIQRLRMSQFNAPDPEPPLPPEPEREPEPAPAPSGGQ